jgi:hypothetical protein
MTRWKDGKMERRKDGMMEEAEGRDGQVLIGKIISYIPIDTGDVPIRESVREE